MKTIAPLALTALLVTTAAAGPVEDAAAACAAARAKADAAYDPGHPMLDCDENKENALRMQGDATDAYNANKYFLTQAQRQQCQTLLGEGGTLVTAGTNAHDGGCVQYGWGVAYQDAGAVWAAQGDAGSAVSAYQDGANWFSSSAFNFASANASYRTAAEVKFQGVLDIIYP